MNTSAYKRYRADHERREVLREILAVMDPGGSDILLASQHLEGQTFPAATPHPLGPPVVTNTTITVDTMLNQPTRVTQMIMDLTLQRFIADRVFANAGGVTGGAVVYDEAIANDLYTNRDIERVEPGMEFPIITSERRIPKVVPVEKWGGKVWIADETRDRNNTADFANQIRRLANTVVRKLNQRAIEVLEASITASGQIAVGRNWSVASDVGPDAQQTTRQNLPFRDFATAQRLADTQELGVVYTLWLLNPNEYANLIILYGAAGFRDVLRALNIDVYVSNRVALGTAYVVAGTSTGEMRVEKPLGSEAWRQASRERTWTQSSVRPVMYVTNPYSVLKFTGLNG